MNQSEKITLEKISVTAEEKEKHLDEIRKICIQIIRKYDGGESAHRRKSAPEKNKSSLKFL